MLPAALLACAAMVHPVTLEAVVSVESGGNPWSVHVNKLASSQQPHPTSAAEAVRVARVYIARGFRVDLGLAQITDSNLPMLGLTVEQAFDPCANLHAGGTILAADYTKAAEAAGPGQVALQRALSAYNTGDFARGFANGYVARYYGRGTVPALRARVTAPAASTRPPPLNPYTADARVWWTSAVAVVP